MLSINKSRNLLFPLIIFLFVVVLSMLRIHGSSVGMYNRLFYGPNYEDPNLLYGQIRPIRSDEYLVSTPWALAQVENNLQEINSLYLAGQNIAISDAPTGSWVGVFEPQNWGFFILPVEQAFAFRWWFKAFLLITAAYVLFMMVSENNLAISIMGALSLVFAPFIQWWYHTLAIEIAAFGIFTFVFYLRILHKRGTISQIIDSALFSYFAICFALTLYPPFQIPLMYFLVVVGAGYLLSFAANVEKKTLRHLAIVLLVNIAVIGSILAIYYFVHKDELYALSHTVYPGNKLASRGKGFELFRALAGFYNIQLLSREVPDIFGNQSEASSFLFYSILLLPYYLFFLIRSVIKRENVYYPILFAIILLCLLLIWGTTGLPTVVAKILVLDRIDSYRMLFMFGIANHLLIIYFLCKFRVDQTLEYKIVAALYAFGVFCSVLAIGRYLESGWPGYIDSDLKIYGISMLAGLLMALLLYQKKLSFFGIFLAYTLISALSVNPLYRGLSPLRDSQLSDAVENIHNRDPQAVWASYHGLYGNYLAANGVRVLNGTYYYPNLGFWHSFDPKQRFDSTYNRYAHVVLEPSTDNKIRFKLRQADVFELIISPCNAILRDLNVQYFLFVSEQASTSCLTQIDKVEFPTMIFYIYERNGEINRSP